MLRLQEYNIIPSYLYFILSCFFSRQDISMYLWLSWTSLCRPDWPRTQKSACLCLSNTRIRQVSPLICSYSALTLIFNIYIRNGYEQNLIFIFQRTIANYHNFKILSKKDLEIKALFILCWQTQDHAQVGTGAVRPPAPASWVLGLQVYVPSWQLFIRKQLKRA